MQRARTSLSGLDQEVALGIPSMKRTIVPEDLVPLILCQVNRLSESVFSVNFFILADVGVLNLSGCTYPPEEGAKFIEDVVRAPNVADSLVKSPSLTALPPCIPCMSLSTASWDLIVSANVGPRFPPPVAGGEATAAPKIKSILTVTVSGTLSLSSLETSFCTPSSASPPFSPAFAFSTFFSLCSPSLMF